MKVTADAVAELNALAGRSGKLTPEQVIEAAEDESSPLHGCFTWDDTEAAAKWRIEEARELIRSVHIEITVEERTVRSVAYVRDQTQPQAVAGYVSTLKVRKQTPDVLRAEFAAVAALLERAAGIAHALDRGDVADWIARIKAQVVAMGDSL